MDQGLLVPDELTCDLVVDRIQQDDAREGYVLDGFPRTIPQAECLTEALNKLGSKIDYAIDVDVPDDNIVKRMGGRRACVNSGANLSTLYLQHRRQRGSAIPVVTSLYSVMMTSRKQSRSV